MANLAQMKVLEGLDGFLLVDKPVNIPFTTVVKTVKRRFGLVKVGHGGSLDAQSSGLLVLLIGDANKFTDQVMGGDREYEGTIDTSYVTNTGDAQGQKVERVGGGEEKKVGGESRWTADGDRQWCVDFNQFKGDVFQVEPKFAAIRKEGTADYEVVDTGDHQQFLGHVYRIELDQSPIVTRASSRGDGEALFESNGSSHSFSLKASKSVLPRALALDMGATLVSLRRTGQWKFDVKDAVPFDKLLTVEPHELPSLVLSIGEALRK